MQVYDVDYYNSRPVQRTSSAKSNTVRNNSQRIKSYANRPDSFEYTKRKKHSTAKQRNIQRAWTNRIIGALAAASIMTGGAKIADNVTAPHENFNGMGHTITEIAEWTGVNTNAILLANDFDDSTQTVNEIILPEVYSPMDDKISEMNLLLSSNKLNDEEKADCRNILEEATEKKDYQDKLATVYKDSDDKFVYIIPKGAVSIEELKDAYGIKDGVIKKHNANIPYTWDVYTNADSSHGYKDYTNSSVPSSGIKIPYDSLGAADE